ncbi:MAG: hypothetical protein JWM11_2895 [Planctomycetaceae bacterium]|nr:hypothetical protein [Planctomycetaceae bacterium]
MIFNFGPPVLAAFIQEFLTLAVIVISVIAWIIRTVQGNSQQLPPPVQRPGRRRDERGDDEIDSFLEQVNRSQSPARSNRPEGSRNQPPATRSNSAKQPPATPQPTPAKQRQPTRQLSEGLPSRQPEAATAARNAPPSQGMSQRSQEQSNARNAKEPQKDLGKSLSQQTQPTPPATVASAPTNLGSFRASLPIQASQTPAQRAGAASPEAATTASFLARTNNLRQALRNPQMISQAIVVQEILSRPKSLRK